MSFYRWHLAIAIGSVITLYANSSVAQITPDATLPNNSNVTLEGKTFNITGGSIVGGNLFHSFKDFSVPTGSTGFFNNAVGIQNIISRVTGGSISNIDGLIKANDTANLFLINPNGIIFGQNARLDIGGSFVATSADRMKFADGFEFSASKLQEKPLLTISVPVGLGMGTNPGEIKVFGSKSGINYSDIKQQPRPRVESNVTGFEVKPEKTLALVGGNVTFEGGVFRSRAGRIEVGSVGANTQLSLIPVAEGWKLGYENVSSFADIRMSGQPFLSATGIGGGYITLFGRDVNLTGQSIIIADTMGDRNGGEISIVGDSITLDEADASNNTFGKGDAGKITLFASNTIKFANQGGVGNHTAAEGNAGQILLQADSILINNQSGAGSNTYVNATGNGGKVFVKANYELQIEDESGLGTTSFGRGNAGEINIAVGKLEIRRGGGMGSSTEGSGNGGQINITANSLLLENLGGFTTSTAKNSTGQAGQINIYVRDSMRLRNYVGIESNTEGAGDAGQININANSLRIEKNSEIKTIASEVSTGKGGEINIITDSLQLLKESSINSSTLGTNNAGEITVSAENVEIDNFSRITTKTFGNGNAGNIKINANSIRLNNNATLTADTQSVNKDPNKPQANININSQNLILRSGSEITANARGDNVIGGNINVDAGVLALLENSRISTDSTDSRGGRVTIKTQGVFGTQSWYPAALRGSITAKGANSQLSGTVQINTPDVDPSSGLIELPVNLVDASRQIDNACTPGSQQLQNTFVATGRSGLPVSPTEPLQENGTLSAWVRLIDKPETTANTINRPQLTVISNPPIAATPIVEASSWIVGSNGNIELVASTSQTPYSSWHSVSCSQ